MSREYWDTFRGNARAQIEVHEPAHWNIEKKVAYEGFVSCRFTWAGGGEMTMKGHGDNENSALTNLVELLEGVSR